MATSSPRTLDRPDIRWALATTAVAAATLAAVLIMQYGFGYEPCHLCIWERWPYLVAGAALAGSCFVKVPRLGLLVAALAFAAGSLLAAYHVGVEEGVFELPGSCLAGEGPAQSIEQLKQMLENAPARCDQVTAAFFGLSLAAWNLVLSVVLTVTSLAGAIWARPSS
ncbi:MAG: disulfide bond formation protein B [Geminicoccaceae bacterium]